MTYGGKKVQHLNEIKNKSPFCLADLLLTRADLNSLVLVVILFIFLYFAASLLFVYCSGILHCKHFVQHGLLVVCCINKLDLDPLKKPNKNSKCCAMEESHTMLPSCWCFYRRANPNQFPRALLECERRLE